MYSVWHNYMFIIIIIIIVVVVLLLATRFGLKWPPSSQYLQKKT
jgi:flagellar basal body-associated protein FliL